MNSYHLKMNSMAVALKDPESFDVGSQQAEEVAALCTKSFDFVSYLWGIDLKEVALMLAMAVDLVDDKNR